MMLAGKVAVVYGAGGSIGGAVARAFASAGAKVHPAGRAEVDALNERAVDRHLESIGRVDISFNAVGFPAGPALGVPLTELDAERFAAPVADYLRSYFLTARLAARRMIPYGSGVIMTVTALHSRTGIALVGGYGPAMAAKEALTRGLSAELAPYGIRVVGLRPQAVPGSATIREAFEPRAEASGMTWEQWQQHLASRTHPRRLLTLDEVAGAAVFLASDQASALTGTTLNLTMGSLDD